LDYWIGGGYFIFGENISLEMLFTDREGIGDDACQFIAGVDEIKEKVLFTEVAGAIV
jgi:hypothetical protein